MKKVSREGYVPSYLGEFAYDDTPLPIEEEMEGFREYEHLRTTALPRRPRRRLDFEDPQGLDSAGESAYSGAS
jgi:hypothetical protein